MKSCLSVLALLLVWPAMARADLFNITLDITQTQDSGIIPTGTDSGTFTTNGTCVLCTPGSGLTEFKITVTTGLKVQSPSPLVFDAFDSKNTGANAKPQYDTATQMLSGDQSDGSLLLSEDIQITGFAPGTILLQLSQTGLKAAPACTDPLNFVGTGCVSIRGAEGVVADGTYTFTTSSAAVPEPSAVILLLTVLALLGTALSRQFTASLPPRPSSPSHCARRAVETGP